MKNNNLSRNTYLPLIISVAVAIGIMIGVYLPGRNVAPQQRTKNDKLKNIISIIETNYVDSVGSEDLIEAAIPAMLKKLDPHSVYIPASDLARANEPLQGNFEGIGISFNLLTDTILVISTIPGGPSEKLGLLPGDKILYVNDSLVAGKGISDEKVMGMLKGPKGTLVRIKILRNGHRDLLPFEITRDKIPMYSIDIAYMVSKNTG